jgi:hypothetical protein
MMMAETTILWATATMMMMTTADEELTDSSTETANAAINITHSVSGVHVRKD